MYAEQIFMPAMQICRKVMFELFCGNVGLEGNFNAHSAPPLVLI